MPKIIKQFPERIGRPPLYPWDTWFDGKIRVLKYGEDFHCLTPSFRTQTYNAANKQGIKVRTALGPESTIVIQAVKNA